jgi:D-xylose transport system ATP-binding protein
MTDVLQVADRIAVLYLGETAAQVARSEVNQQQLVELITTGGHSPAATNGVPA